MEGALALVFNNLMAAAEKAGVPWEVFWSERVMATYTASVVSLVLQAVFVALCMVGFILVVRWTRRARAEGDENWPGGLVVIVAGSLILIILLSVITTRAITGVINPEYQTISDLYDKAGSIISSYK